MRPWRRRLITALAIALALLALALLWQADTAQMAQITPLRATHTPLPYVTPGPTWAPPAYPAPEVATPRPVQRAPIAPLRRREVR